MNKIIIFNENINAKILKILLCIFIPMFINICFYKLFNVHYRNEENYEKYAFYYIVLYFINTIIFSILVGLKFLSHWIKVFILLLSMNYLAYSALYASRYYFDLFLYSIPPVYFWLIYVFLSTLFISRKFSENYKGKAIGISILSFHATYLIILIFNKIDEIEPIIHFITWIFSYILSYIVVKIYSKHYEKESSSKENGNLNGEDLINKYKKPKNKIFLVITFYLFFIVNGIFIYHLTIESTKDILLSFYLFNVFCFSVFLATYPYGESSFSGLGSTFSFFTWVYAGVSYGGEYGELGSGIYFFICWFIFVIILSLFMTLLVKKNYRIMAFGSSILTIHIFVALIYFLVPKIMIFFNFDISYILKPFYPISISLIFFPTYLMITYLATLFERKRWMPTHRY